MGSSLYFLGLIALATAQFDSNTCDLKKACFIPVDDNCYNGCNGMGFSYFFSDRTYKTMKIELFGKSDSRTGFYIAVGFSKDSMMGAESVIECSSIGQGNISLKFSYNQQNFFSSGEPSNIRIKDEENYESYFKNQSINYMDGVVYCSADVNVAGADNDQIFKFDPSDPHYWLLMANGPTNTAGLLHHVHDVTTASSVNLLDVSPPFDPNGCGVTKGCFIPTAADCHNSAPDMVVSYFMKDNESLVLEIVGPASDATGYYVAVGFSDDNKMGNESVIECSSIGNQQLSTKFSYNDATPRNVRIVNETQLRTSYITPAIANFQDGNYYCKATIKVGGDPNNSQIFKYDPNMSYYLLLAQGTTNATSGGLNHHLKTCVPQFSLKLAQNEPSFNQTACGTGKTCFLPTNCYMGCNGMGFSFKMINTGTMQLEIFAVASDLGNYVAVGFSLDELMGDESVIECSSINNQSYSLKFSYNTGGQSPFNTRIDGEENVRSQLITNETNQFADGRIYCSGIIDVSGTNKNASNLIFRYDQNKNYYFLMASGKTDDVGLTKHVDHVVSPLPYDLTTGNQINLTNSFFDCSTCGKSKGCFFPDDPSLKSCNDFGVSWKYISDTQMEFELTKKGTDGYVAVGFSSDNLMGDDEVIEFSQLTGLEWSWKFSYNDNQPKNVRIPNATAIEKTYFTQTSFNFSNGILYARATVNVGGWNGIPQVFQYNSSMEYFLLLAMGNSATVDQNGLKGHDEKAPSPFAFNLTTMQAVQPTQPPPNTAFDCSQCGATKGCFFPNGDKDCSGMGVAYHVQGPGLMLVELMKPDTTGYVAVGFNPTSPTMPNAQVIECSQLIGESLSMKFSYNGNTKMNYRIPNETSIESTYFTQAAYKTENGQMYCSALVNVGGWGGSDQVFTYNPDQKYFLLVAAGTTSSTALLKHSDVKTSNEAVDLAADGTTGADKTKQRLIHAHAIMMILAWICFVPTALLFARFLRASWPLVKPGGLLIWFHVHRTANLIGIVLMIASFVCIMCATNWKWTGPGSSASSWAQAHTMTGLFALIFAWMQPFVSFMRCHPNTPNRPFFNWTHRGIGALAYILATTALTIAAAHFNKFSNNTTAIVLAVIPIGIMTFLVIAFPILDFIQDRNDHQHATLEMVRQVVVLVCVGLVVGDAVAMSVMVQV